MDTQDIVTSLNNLIETCKDGEYGFRSSAEYAQSSPIKQLFTTRAAGCAQAAAELQTLVQRHGGEAETDGTTSGTLHRGWVAVKGTLAGSSDLSMLEEAERGEDTALERYRDALREDHLPSEARDIVERQYEGVKRNHDQIRNLRNQARATSE